MEISKLIKFEAGHRLAKGYPGNCQHAHGHSYTVTILMDLKENAKLNKFGFVKDYNDFKPLKKWVDDNWDHAFLVSADDSPMLKFLQDNNQRMFIFDDNPSAENIAKRLFTEASRLLDDDFSFVSGVKVKETATSEAVYIPVPVPVLA